MVSIHCHDFQTGVVSDFTLSLCLLLLLSLLFLFVLSNRRYAQLICSVITLQGGSDWGVGGGGETMMVHDVNTMRTEMIGKNNMPHVNINVSPFSHANRVILVPLAPLV